MAGDAVARLYDVDEDTVVFKKLDRTKAYDQGTYSFRAREGKLVDLTKLHESVWATRLSGGTRSGLVRLDVTAVGEVRETDSGLVLHVAGSDNTFVLARSKDKKYADAINSLRKEGAGSGKTVRVTGRIDDYFGRWPNLLKRRPKTPRRMLVTSYEFDQG